MSVYIDNTRNPYGRMLLSHMIADTEEELHAMAAAIGMQRDWFQPADRASWPHYVSVSRREAAIARGAIACDKRDLVGHIRRLRALTPPTPSPAPPAAPPRAQRR